MQTHPMMRSLFGPFALIIYRHPPKWSPLLRFGYLGHLLKPEPLFLLDRFGRGLGQLFSFDGGSGHKDHS